LVDDFLEAVTQEFMHFKGGSNDFWVMSACFRLLIGMGTSLNIEIRGGMMAVLASLTKLKRC
jgi:hypothetical protein